jgi:uncharacterized transporter YbjL
MKWMILVLWLAAGSGLIGAITNVQRFSMGRETTVVHYTHSGRLFALVVGLTCAAAAYMCTKKKKSGWRLVAVMIIALMLATAWGVVRVISTDLFIAISWLAQIVFMAVLFRWWLRQAKCFSPNEERA